MVPEIYALVSGNPYGERELMEASAPGPWPSPHVQASMSLVLHCGE